MPSTMKPSPEWEAFVAEHPCPVCGSDPHSDEYRATDEIRMWNLGAPTLNGHEWVREMTCVNGHTTRYDFGVTFYDEPIRLY